MKVVCVKGISPDRISVFGKPPNNQDHVIVGEIYTVIKSEQIPYFETGLAYYLLEKDSQNKYSSSLFRPISECGPAICEWIEETAFKEYQLEEAIKQ